MCRRAGAFTANLHMVSSRSTESIPWKRLRGKIYRSHSRRNQEAVQEISRATYDPTDRDITERARRGNKVSYMHEAV